MSYRQSPLFAAGAFVDTMEVAATWSRLMPMYDAVRAALAPHVFVMAHFSHAYPDGGSIYFSFAGAGRDDEDATRRYDRAWAAALAAAIDAGGVLSHHHGVGRSKAPAMRREQGAAVDVVRALQREMDPSHVLNPGALVGDADGAATISLPAPSAPAAGASASEITPRALVIDERSGIVHVGCDVTLAEVERALEAHGLTLGLRGAPMDAPVGQWLASGAPGARAHADDPVAQLLSGLDFVRADGTPVSIRPAPRRAVGPDLVDALVAGRAALGAVRGAHLVARRALASELVAYRFASRRDAEVACAQARGAGVRPAWTELEDGARGSAPRDGGGGVTLRVALEGPLARRRMQARVLDRAALARGGARVARSDEPG